MKIIEKRFWPHTSRVQMYLREITKWIRFTNYDNECQQRWRQKLYLNIYIFSFVLSKTTSYWRHLRQNANYAIDAIFLHFLNCLWCFEISFDKCYTVYSCFIWLNWYDKDRLVIYVCPLLCSKMFILSVN